VVTTGQHVLKGQVIAGSADGTSAAVHASSSGTVTDISSRPIPSRYGAQELCIEIETDGKDRWVSIPTINADVCSLPPTLVKEKIQEAGIVGLGGAGFPSAVKMLPGNHPDVRLMILNAVECDPYISCDEALIREYALQVVQGLQILRHAAQALECVIAIRSDMSEAKSALVLAIDSTDGPEVKIASLSTIYPAGGEKQVVKSLTGFEVPDQGLPLDLGIICYNVGTALATYQAIKEGKPLISRIVTVTGGALREPRNLDVMVGTPIRNLIEQFGNCIDDPEYLIAGGAMMGFSLPSDDVPLLKTTNCIIAAAPGEFPAQQTANECIRCGDCVAACPASLFPQELYQDSRTKNYDRARSHGLFACIECGCCTYVCPSRIPLVDYYRQTKLEIKNLTVKDQEAQLARQRYESREARIAETRDAVTSKVLVDPKPDPETMRSEIEAAVARAKFKRGRRENKN